MEKIRARLSRTIDAPELSRMWESEVNVYRTPEVVFHVEGNEVTIEYPSQPHPVDASGLKRAFEQTVHRFLPHCEVEWLDGSR
ncbi:MAG: hypothetical protein ACK5AZ_00730 [Bryobacteraceae bacterium]